MSLVADVAGTTVANDAFWAEKCMTIPSSTKFIVLDMGAVRDFFKPTEGSTYCDMLQAHNKHQWSPNGVDWVAVAFFGGSDHNGGSANWWPRDKGVEGDARKHLSFWGVDDGRKGGWGSTSTAVGWGIWGQSFTLSYAIELQPLPPNTGMSLVVEVAGNIQANKAYWKEQCKKIPLNAVSVVLDMGAVRDFFRPTTGTYGTRSNKKPVITPVTFCEMLIGPWKHQWSHDGLTWTTGSELHYNQWSGHNGGSEGTWPRVDGDKRDTLSFWGTDDNGATGGAHSTSMLVGKTHPSLPENKYTCWGHAFTLSYAVQLQPLPPNTGMSLVADVPGTTLTNDAFWAEQCKTIPSSTAFIVLDMGAVRDFFKPTEGSTYCDMLQAHNKHQWSPNGVDWVAVVFLGGSDHNGGSANWWPRDKGVEGDARKHLSFWGFDDGRKGGCCSTSTAVDTGGWGKSFTLSYAIQLQPLPPNTGMSLVVEVAGNIQANKAYWKEQCKTIPSSTAFLVLDMGAVRDFFRPIAGASYCDMMTSSKKHQWSSDGSSWKTPGYLNSNFGTSSLNWPRDFGKGDDVRAYLSAWGHGGVLSGGCCSSVTTAHMSVAHPAVPGNGIHTTWGQSFTVSYAIQLQPLSPNTGMSLVTNVAGTMRVNDAYWAEKCKTIPSSTAFIVLDMGAVRDFFRPIAGASYCDMMTSSKKHQWSNDGVTWTTPEVTRWSGDLGSSADNWPRDTVEGDERYLLSSWGNQGVLTGGCCSTSTTMHKTKPSLPGNLPHWGQSFTVSYAIQLHPLPPNTGMSLVIDVPGTTVANDAFWAEKCMTIPSSTKFIVLDMGAVRDFFKPTEGNTYCAMLQSSNKHQWSPDGVDWFTVDFYYPDIVNGGSAMWWPRDSGRDGDERAGLANWGYSGSLGVTGGCCSSSTAVRGTYPSLRSDNTHNAWGQSFTLSYAIQRQPLPPNTGMSLVANVAGTTKTNNAFWKEQCKIIPSNTAFLVLDMGAVRDFFKPTEGSTYCEMLQAHNKHQWSANGIGWFDVAAFEGSNHLGGSAEWWPRDNGLDVDGRSHLSFWGVDDGRSGGCCSTSTAMQTVSWGQSFTISYAVPLQPLAAGISMTVFADVASTTLANGAYWGDMCRQIPSSTLFVVLDMGTVRDFFKPADESTTYCGMLYSFTKHQWSADGIAWIKPDPHTCNYGGSANNWPKNNIAEDERAHLSFWGPNCETGHAQSTGGCCASSPAQAQNMGWGQHFTMSFAYSTATSKCGLPRDNWRFEQPSNQSLLLNLESHGISYGDPTTQDVCFAACSATFACKQAIYNKLNATCFPARATTAWDPNGSGNEMADFASIDCNRPTTTTITTATSTTSVTFTTTTLTSVTSTTSTRSTSTTTTTTTTITTTTTTTGLCNNNPDPAVCKVVATDVSECNNPYDGSVVLISHKCPVACGACTTSSTSTTSTTTATTTTTTTATSSTITTTTSSTSTSTPGNATSSDQKQPQSSSSSTGAIVAVFLLLAAAACVGVVYWRSVNEKRNAAAALALALKTLNIPPSAIAEQQLLIKSAHAKSLKLKPLTEIKVPESTAASAATTVTSTHVNPAFVGIVLDSANDEMPANTSTDDYEEILDTLSSLNPTLNEQPWFHGALTTEACEKLLNDTSSSPGSFLVWYASDDTAESSTYMLSYRPVNVAGPVQPSVQQVPSARAVAAAAVPPLPPSRPVQHCTISRDSRSTMWKLRYTSNSNVKQFANVMQLVDFYRSYRPNNRTPLPFHQECSTSIAMHGESGNLLTENITAVEQSSKASTTWMSGTRAVAETTFNDNVADYDVATLAAPAESEVTQEEQDATMALVSTFIKQLERDGDGVCGIVALLNEEVGLNGAGLVDSRTAAEVEEDNVADYDVATLAAPAESEVTQEEQDATMALVSIFIKQLERDGDGVCGIVALLNEEVGLNGAGLVDSRTAAEVEGDATTAKARQFLSRIERDIEGVSGVVASLIAEDAKKPREQATLLNTSATLASEDSAEYLEVIGALGTVASAASELPETATGTPSTRTPPLTAQMPQTRIPLSSPSAKYHSNTIPATTTAATAGKGYDDVDRLDYHGKEFISPPAEMVLINYVPCLNVEVNQPTSKFVAPVMVLGKNTISAQGLATIMGVHPKTYRDVRNKVAKIVKEFKKSGTAEDNANIANLMAGTYANPDKPGDILPSVAEVMESSPEVEVAGLHLHHVLALRLYTTSSYKSINDPFRNQPYPRLPHPFAATLYYISDALTKLRAVQGANQSHENREKIFWRGMIDLRVTKEFLEVGGTEMSCMSTTSSKEVAADFAKKSKTSPLLFKLSSNDFMSHGADISFLSVYPEEQEILYPPITYLSPISKEPSIEVIDGREYQVIEVKPSFGSLA